MCIYQGITCIGGVLIISDTCFTFLKKVSYYRYWVNQSVKHSMWGGFMSKSRDKGREKNGGKKEAKMTLKEKRAAKKEKRG